MMDQSFVERLEEASQELHTAKQQINVLNATVAHLSEENADLQRELSVLADKEKDDKILIKSVSDKCQSGQAEVADLKERLQHALEEKDLAQKNVEELSNWVSSLQEKDQSDASKLSAVCMCETETAVLQEKLDQLELDKKLKSDQLADAVADLHKALEKNTNMKAEMEELQMELECLQSQFSSQCNIIQCQREDLEGLRSQAEIESSCIDTNRKGNSLFSEVEDRRVMVETQMVKTLDKAQRLEVRLKKERKENQRLKNQVSMLMRKSQGASDETVRTLEQELEESKEQVFKLTEQLAQQEQCKKTPTEPHLSLPLSDNETPLMTYLKATVSQLQKEREDLKKENNNLQIQVVQLDFLWTQKKNESRSLKSEKDKLTEMNNHQSIVIESLKSESESGEEVPPKSLLKISLTNQSTDNLCSVGFKEQIDCNDSALAGLPEIADLDGCSHNESDKRKTGFSNNKENASYHDLKSFLLGSKPKSVAFAPDMTDPLLDVGNLVEGGGEHEDDKCKKGVALKKSGGNGTGKYRSVTYVTMEDATPEEEAPECKQQ